jgi:predicted Zn-dependent peptidase
VKKNFIIVSIALVAFSVIVSAQTHQQLTLPNGLSVELFPNSGSGTVSAVLVCPFPADISSAEMADVSLLNYIMWHGSTAGDKATTEADFLLLGDRFGGVISSRLTNDALIFSYSVPTELFDTVLRQLSAQWDGLSHNPERRQAMAAGLLANYQEEISGRVQRQLMREIEDRIWEVYSYRLPAFGSQADLQAVTEESLNATFRRLKNPANWTLIIAGMESDDLLQGKLEATVGAIPPAEQAETSQLAKVAAMSGKLLRLPSDLEDSYAVVSYKLPPASELNLAELDCYAEAVRQSIAMQELYKSLGGGAEISIGIDYRKQASLLLVTAKWSNEETPENAITKITEMLTIELDELMFAAIKKAKLINYWQRYQSSSTYSNLIANLIANGTGYLDYPGKIEAVTQASINAALKDLLVDENVLSLITVAK